MFKISAPSIKTLLIDIFFTKIFLFNHIFETIINHQNLNSEKSKNYIN